MDLMFQNTLKVADKVLHMARNDVLHPSILLYGHAGVGKSTAIENIIKKILCVISLVSPDLMIVRDKKALDGAEKKTRGISVDEVRQAIDFSNTSSVGARKILAFDGIDKMSNSAVNSVLKLVEEPPKGLYIFLVTRNLYALPKTLLSRCMKFFVEKPDFDDFKKFFPDFSDDLINYLYRACEGNINIIKPFLEDCNDNLIQKILQKEVSLADLKDCPDSCFDVIMKVVLFEIKTKAESDPSFIKKFELIQEHYSKIEKYSLNKGNVIFTLSQLT